MAGARQTGMANVCVMNSDFWSSFNNQAGLAFNKTFSFGFNYENRFSIKELGTRTAAITIPAGRVSIGVVYSNFGYSDFKRQMIGVACGMPVSNNLTAGIQIDYFSVRTSGDYNNYQVLTCETGIIVTPSDNVKIGVHIFNPVPNSLRKADIPAELRIGAGVNLSKELFAGIETRMSTGQKLFIRTGFEYEAAKNFLLRGGFATENNSFCFGAGYRVGLSIIEFGFATHEKLGVTSSVSLIFEIKTINRKNR
jgi:hypothetical protein